MRTLSFSIPPFSAMIPRTWTTWPFRTWDIAAYHAHSTCFQARQKVWLVKRVDFDELQTSWRRFFWRFLPLDLNCGNPDFRPGGHLFTWTMTNAGSFAWQSNNKRKYITLDYEEEFELSPRKGRVCWLNRLWHYNKEREHVWSLKLPLRKGRLCWGKKNLDFVENFETDPKERKSLLSKKKCGSGWGGGGTMVALRGKEGQEDNG